MYGRSSGTFRHKTCSTNTMLIVLGLFGLSAASVALLVHELRIAPEGYEDHNGFHIVDKPATGFKTWIFRHRPAAERQPRRSCRHRGKAHCQGQARTRLGHICGAVNSPAHAGPVSQSRVQHRARKNGHGGLAFGSNPSREARHSNGDCEITWSTYLRSPFRRTPCAAPNLRRKVSITTNPMPSNAKAEPPSGTALLPAREIELAL